MEIQGTIDSSILFFFSAVPPPSRAKCYAYGGQSYNDGSAPFPYAAECTLSSSTCDPSALVSEMDFAEQAHPISLDLDSNSSSDAAVELVRGLD